MHSVSAILIAAGESTRMGHPKSLMPWNGMPLIQYQTQSLLKAGLSEVIVVLGHECARIAPHVEGTGVKYLENRKYRDGKTSSIKAGIQAINPNTESILILAVDQPRSPSIITSIIDSHIGNKALITSPVWCQRVGHPLIFARKLKSEIERITEKSHGLRKIMYVHRKKVNEVIIENPMIWLDLNSPEEYEKAKEQYSTT